MEINYKFDMDDKVKVPLTDAEGMITMLGFDDGGRQYFVITTDKGLNDKWWREDKLSKIS